MKKILHLIVFCVVILLSVSSSWSEGVTGTLVALNKAEATASLIDLKTGEVRATLPTGNGPHEAAVSPDGNFALVGNYGSRGAPGSSLTVIDTATRRVVRRIPQDLKAADTDGRLFGSQFDDSSVPIGIVIHPAGGRAWVAHTNADVIAEIDLGTWRVDRLLQAGREPDGMDYSPVIIEKK